MHVVPTRGLLGLVEERQTHVGEVGDIELHAEFGRRGGGGSDEPLRDGRTEPPGPGAGDHHKNLL
jgi:hypothetical protein